MVRGKTDIITKLKKSGLKGRGGACFATWAKWSMVKVTPGRKKYVVVNGSEGEPGAKKDHYILENHPEKLIDGIRIALDYLNATKAYIYLNPVYFKKFGLALRTLIKDRPIELVRKPEHAGYAGGEETSVLNALEGRRIEPRLKPPFPPESGLWHYPTLINNVETLYAVSLIASGDYYNERLYTIGGDCLWTGVYSFPEDLTIKKILKKTDNLPNYDFFVQVGGDASGEALNRDQLERPAAGNGQITVYSVYKHNPSKLIAGWLNFFARESCGQCAPCREGTFRLREMAAASEPDWEKIAQIMNALSETSFCGLGCAAPVAVTSYINNVLSKIPENKLKLKPGIRHKICECFS